MAGPSADRGRVEVEIVEDEHDDVLDAMVAARASTVPTLADVSGVPWYDGRPSRPALVGADAADSQPTGFGVTGLSTTGFGVTGPGTTGPDTTDGDGPPAGGGVRSAAARRRTRARRATVAGVVLAVAAGSSAVESAQQAARLAALAEVPGVLEPIEEPLRPLWAVPGDWFSGETSSLVLLSAGQAVQAVDPATGTVVWSRTAGEGFLGEYCSPLVPRGPSGAWLLAGAGGDDAPSTADLLLCRSHSAFTNEIGEVGSTRRPRLTVVDGATGRDLHALPQAGSLIGLELVADGDVVALASGQAGHLEATRWDVATGAEVWRYRSEHPVLGPDRMGVERLERRGDVVLVDARSAVAVDLTTGADVDPATARASTEPAWFEETPLDRAETAVWHYPAHAPGGEGYVRTALGRVRFDLPGPVWVPEVDDGSRPDVLVVGSVSGRTLRGLNRSTGAQLWAASSGGGWPLARLDGYMVVQSGSRLQSVDLRNGQVRWSVPVDLAWGVQPLTDGNVVLALQSGASGAPDLVAYSLSDGVERWRTPAPEGTQSVTATSTGNVVAVTRHGLIGLG